MIRMKPYLVGIALLVSVTFIAPPTVHAQSHLITQIESLIEELSFKQADDPYSREVIKIAEEIIKKQKAILKGDKPFVVEFWNSEEELVIYEDEMSATYGVFRITFAVTAGNNDIFIPGTLSAIDSGAGVVFSVVGKPNAQITSDFDSNAEREDDYYVVREGETEEFDVIVVVDPSVTARYSMILKQINYSMEASAPHTSLALNKQFRTKQIKIPNGKPTGTAAVMDAVEDQFYAIVDTVRGALKL